ncbi:MAG: MraY family glycosyltransferase [Methylococcaceae bacterium]|nr:MraY family glycosyltransferase [Methylococcaceae bacterium]
MKLADRLRFLDIPDERKVHVAVIPRVGGIGIVSGMLITLILWINIDSTLRIVFAGVGLLSIFGMADDRCDLDYRLKFLGQFIAALIVVCFGGIVIHRIGLFGIESIPDWIAYPLTVLFLLGTTNAMNLSDGLDGLAAGLSVLSLACIAYLAELANGEEIIAVSVTIIGAVLGFLRYNTHPAVVFMGDTGSQFLGFSAGILAVLLTQQVNTAISSALPLMILGLPIADTLLVMGERLARRVSPFKPDRNHFHHKLLALGFDHYESVLLIYALQALFIALAYFLRYESDLLVLAVYIGLFMAIAAFFPLAQNLRWRVHALTYQRKSLLTRNIEILSRKRWLEKAAYQWVRLAVPVFLLTGILAKSRIGMDLGLSALAILMLWFMAALLHSPLLVMAERLAIYSCVILVIYLVVANDPHPPRIYGYFPNFLIALAFAVGMGIRFSTRYFTVTPSDFLVLFILIVAGNLPVYSEVHYARMLADAAVVLYGVEYLLRYKDTPSLILRFSAITTLSAATLRSLL